MVFQGDSDGCTIHLNNNNDDNKRSMKVVHQFYMAKINRFFPDPVLQINLHATKKSLNRIEAKRRSLLNKIQLSKDKLESLRLDIRTRNYKAESLIQSFESGREFLHKHWPKSVNENLEVKESNPKIELVELKGKIPGLIEQLGHGKTKWAKEKQILKELEHLQRREVLLDGKIKEAESKIPFSIHRPRHYWYYGSMNKYDLKQHLHRCLKEIKEHEEQEKVAKMQRVPQMVKLEKQISSLEKKYNILKQEEQKTKDCLLALEIQVNKQIALYEKYCKLQKKVQELATQKKLVTLEKLSFKEIEEFISRWTNDDEFRANYIRSIQLSLADRELCSDGRMLLDPSKCI